MNEKIKAYSSTITAGFSALVVLYGVFKFISQSNANTESMKALRQQTEQIQGNQGTLSMQLDSVLRSTKDISDKVDKIGGTTERIKNQFAIHLAKDKAITKEELLEILNELNEKKN